jgi:hypothetical protein
MNHFLQHPHAHFANNRPPHIDVMIVLAPTFGVGLVVFLLTSPNHSIMFRYGMEDFLNGLIYSHMG